MLDFIYKEGPESAMPYSEKFSKMLAPVWELVKKKNLVSTWKKENPWTFRNQPWLVAAFKHAEEVGLERPGEMG